MSLSSLKENVVSLHDMLAKEGSSKQNAIECHRREEESRVAAEKVKVTSLKDMYKRLQEYNTCLQQYNSKLHTDLEIVQATHTRAEKEKSSILENLSTLRAHSKSLQDQLASIRVLQDDAIKQKDLLLVFRLRIEFMYQCFLSDFE